MQRKSAAIALALALSLAACGSSSDSTAAGNDNGLGVGPDNSADAGSSATETDTVTIQASKYGPADISVAAGTTVTFDNVDPFAHTVTDKADAKAFDSGRVEGDGSFEFTFDEAGTYNYFCEIHPTMRGTVTVQ